MNDRTKCDLEVMLYVLEDLIKRRDEEDQDWTSDTRVRIKRVCKELGLDDPIPDWKLEESNDD